MADAVKRKVVLCAGTACADPGGKKLEPEIYRLLQRFDVEHAVEIEEAVCYGNCGKCPMLVVQPENSFYTNLTADYSASPSSLDR